MEEEKSNIIFNISGGNNQILPNATKAEQHFYGDKFAKDALRSGDSAEAPLTDDERRLMLYIRDEEKMRNYVASLKACESAADVGQVVAIMCENEPNLYEQTIVKEEFIKKLIPFLIGVDKGKGVDNLRIFINKAWAERKLAKWKK